MSRRESPGTVMATYALLGLACFYQSAVLNTGRVEAFLLVAQPPSITFRGARRRYPFRVLPSSKKAEDAAENIFFATDSKNNNAGETKIDSTNGASRSKVENPEGEALRRQRSLVTPATTASTRGLSAEGIMRAMGTSPRRVALSFLSASGIALAGNFLGVTSNLLAFVPEETVETSGLDTYFPRGDFKRCRSKGYTFVIPKEWVADTFVELAKAQRQVRPLDYQMKRSSSIGGVGTLPDSAFGPPGRLNQQGVSESGDTNVSVIVTSRLQGFSLRNTLGPPQTAAEKLLNLSIAPPESGRKATLLDAVEDTSRNVYQFEYTVDRGERGPALRNISVVAASRLGDKLYTLTVVSPLQQWSDPVFVSKLRKIATSFHLT